METSFKIRYKSVLAICKLMSSAYLEALYETLSYTQDEYRRKLTMDYPRGVGTKEFFDSLLYDSQCISDISDLIIEEQKEIALKGLKKLAI